MVRAARQGSLDGLCGVYAVINSLEPAGVTLHRSLQRELFQQLVYSLGASALLAAMHDGMDALTLQGAAQLAFGWLAATHDTALEVELPFNGRRFRSSAGFVRALRPLVAAPNTAAIIAFRGVRKSHWTVVRAVEGSTLLLRDSDGLTALDAREFGVSRGRRYFWPTDTLVVRQTG